MVRWLVWISKKGTLWSEKGERVVYKWQWGGGAETEGRKEGTASTEDLGVRQVLPGEERNGENLENLLTIERILTEKSCSS